MRNSDLDGITSTITLLERQFNEHFRYPYVLLNDVPFEQTSKEWVVPTTTQGRLSGLNWLKKIIAVLSNSQNQKLKLDSSWPNTGTNHNETKASLARRRLLKDGVAYGGEFVMLILFSAKLFTVGVVSLLLKREPFVRLSWSGYKFLDYSYIIEDIKTCVDSLQE